MQERVEITPADECRLLVHAEFFREVSRRLSNRLMLDDGNIPINSNLPIGGKQLTNRIRDYIPAVCKVISDANSRDELNFQLRHGGEEDLNLVNWFNL